MGRRTNKEDPKEYKFRVEIRDYSYFVQIRKGKWKPWIDIACFEYRNQARIYINNNLQRIHNEFSEESDDS